MKYNPRDENSIKAVMAKANVVINLIGIVHHLKRFLLILTAFVSQISELLYSSTGREYETRNYSFEEVNHHMAEQLAVVSFLL